MITWSRLAMPWRHSSTQDDGTPRCASSGRYQMPGRAPIDLIRLASPAMSGKRSLPARQKLAAPDLQVFPAHVDDGKRAVVGIGREVGDEARGRRAPGPASSGRRRSRIVRAVDRLRGQQRPVAEVPGEVAGRLVGRLVRLGGALDDAGHGQRALAKLHADAAGTHVHEEADAVRIHVPEQNAPAPVFHARGVHCAGRRRRRSTTASACRGSCPSRTGRHSRAPSGRRDT